MLASYSPEIKIMNLYKHVQIQKGAGYLDLRLENLAVIGLPVCRGGLLCQLGIGFLRSIGTDPFRLCTI